MKFSILCITITALLATTAFGQNARQLLDQCAAERGDLQMQNRQLNQDLEAARRNTHAANAVEVERDRARHEAQTQRNRADSLQARVNELTPLANQAQICQENLATLLAAGGGQAATATAAIPATAMASTFRYPLGATVTAMSVQTHNNAQVIVTDFSFTNMGSRTITAVDVIVRFFFQENLIFETPIPNVRQSGNAAVARNGSFAFRSGMAITAQTQQLLNMRPEQIDLVVEVTRIH